MSADAAPAPDAAPLLEVEGVTVSYGAIQALKEASLRIERGEIVALIGANGAGKTTTLRAVSGMVEPRAGKVRFDGHNVGDFPVHHMVRLGMSHVPEGRGIFANLSVEENLHLGGFTRTDAEIAEGIERGFALFPRLKERRTQNAGTLSGGEQQMLAIARGLICKPKLLLLDEPSLGLAPQIIENIFQIIVDINKQGMSILLVEQNAHQALHISHRGYVLETGRIMLTDTGKALLANEMVRKLYLGE
jgi:branched-chain amino acid transport system ATP-binding protein